MRTNATIAEVCAYFADGLTENDVRDFYSRHSVDVRKDTIYSYGSHFPMAKIVRDSKGRAKRLIINTDSYHSNGWHTTGEHQGALSHALQAKAEGGTELHKVLNTYDAGRARVRFGRRTIDVLRVPLTHFKGSGLIFAAEDPNDPAPPKDWAHARREIPPPFHASDPGPPPKDLHPERCVAGVREEYEYQASQYAYDDDFDRPPRGAVLRVRRDGTYTSKRWVYWRTGVLEYGSDEHRWDVPEHVTYIQCPHCMEFRSRYNRWRYAFYGSYYTRNDGKGYQTYSRYMREFGSVKAWREAGRESFREAKRRRQARADWVERNTLPFSEVPKRNGIPVLDSEGRASRTALEKYQCGRRNRARRLARQAKREAERAAERKRLEAIGRAERARQFAEARKAWEEGLEFKVPDSVAAWCLDAGLKPEPNGTVIVVKAVEEDYMSAHGALYEPDSNVVDGSFDPYPGCGGGLHFSPSPRQANRWARGPVHRYMRVAVPLIDIVVIDSSKMKAPHAYVERELTAEEVAKLDAGEQW